MSDQLSTLLNQYQNAFQPNIPRYRQNRFVQIVVLRETKSHAIFTTEGRTLDVERLQAGIRDSRPVDRVVMYKRKQVAPERRTGKALLRDLGVMTAVKLPGDKKEFNRAECQIMGNSCGKCIDCILYGFAATQGTGSQRARVLTDSGFIVRSEPQVMRDIKLNAIQDTVAGGIAGSAFAGRENLLPQVFIPTVETLVDVTAGEFVYVLGNILKTTRYGAESNREGFLRNHVLAIYFSDVEIFSNLELTQHFYDALPKTESGEINDYLSLEDFTGVWENVEKEALKGAVGRIRKVNELTTLLENVRTLYADEAALRGLLQSLDKEVLRYVRDSKSKDKDKDKADESEG